jgi:hypothetical protein
MAHGHQAGNLAIDPELKISSASESETSLIDRNFFPKRAFDSAELFQRACPAPKRELGA